MNISQWQKTSRIILTVSLSLMIILFGFVIYNAAQDSQSKESAAIEEVINKALLQCYALEGAYPADIYYLANNYGIILNEGDYFYYYEAYGANLFPTVKVIKK